MKHSLPLIALLTLITSCTFAQITHGNRSGFSWITTEQVMDDLYGSGYSMYSAAWPMFKKYPGPENFQMGLAGCWLTPQHSGDVPEGFYNTIEGGLGWWHDTRFGTRIPKFIMGGVSNGFFAWANGPGAGRSDMLGNGQRDWSTPGGKYGVAQLSNRLLWSPDGLNMAQSLNGEMLGYGYTPLPITEVLEQTNGQDVQTGNQCWTLFLNTTNFSGPATFFMPTFWTEPVLEDFSLEGLFFDTRPSNPNFGKGLEHAVSPALMSEDSQGTPYAKIEQLQFPASNESSTMALSQISVYSQESLWDAMEGWFNGGAMVSSESMQYGANSVSFVNNGGSIIGEIAGGGDEYLIALDYIQNVQQTSNVMGWEFNLNTVTEDDGYFVLPEYFRLESDNEWHAIDAQDVPASTNLMTSEVPISARPEVSYLTPKEPDCAWQDPYGPWNNPGPMAGPFYADLGDGSTVTYHWYRFVDQPAIVHANLPEEMREEMQARVELIHSNWSHTDEYMAPPVVGNLATLDPGVIVEPPVGLEIGYVPIVTRQESTPEKVRVFVLAGQSNMQGYGKIEDAENDPGTLVHVIANDEVGYWDELGDLEGWTTLNDAYIYFANNGDTIRENITVGQGAFSELIGPELMFAHELDAYYDDPILIIKTAWGGKNLAEDFRPPSAGGITGAYYDDMIETVDEVTQNLGSEFPEIGVTDFEISGFAWFQGWNDGATPEFLEEYEDNLYNLVNDVRSDLGNIDLPVVVANSGHGGFMLSNDMWVQNMQNIVSVAQENVGCNNTLYGGSVGLTDTKQFYIDDEQSPDNSIHHFHNNALTFLNVGKAIGEEMILAINDMAFCYTECEEQVVPGIVSIGNRVWNDINMDGVNDPYEPGIPGVSLVLWGDSDGDEVPDWQGFSGVEITDEDGYYRFSGLEPGNYVVFVWQVDNWEEGQPLYGFESTNIFIADADNDVDLDNNGFGASFTDIMSGIVTLSLGDEPLNDGDPFDCLFDYDGSGNNTVDFGFFNPNSTCFADLNNDNIITVADLLMVLSEFGCIVNCENTDVNNDDVTTVIDLLAILSVFGTVCE
tara:strand:- start:105 stop:3299 length:3195 start_codon:yes stop_codon:yes gene_type:complete